MPKTNEHFFAVHYAYHQYNGGDGFSGTRTNVLRLAGRDEAVELARRISAVAARAASRIPTGVDEAVAEEVEQADRALTDELVVTGMSGGFLLSAEVWETTVERCKVPVDVTDA